MMVCNPLLVSPCFRVYIIFIWHRTEDSQFEYNPASMLPSVASQVVFFLVLKEMLSVFCSSTFPLGTEKQSL